jgi:hypothetical protein
VAARGSDARVARGGSDAGASAKKRISIYQGILFEKKTPRDEMRKEKKEKEKEKRRVNKHRGHSAFVPGFNLSRCTGSFIWVRYPV